MREIKFRAWDVESKSMAFVETLHLGEKIKPQIENCGWDWYKRDYKLMQYTESKDTNNREIYDGDILGFCDFDSLRTGGNTSDKMHTAVVKFSEGSWVVEDGGYCDYLYQVIANDSELEVIGNIYENPELLK